jgi:hypothetical protein
VACSCGVADRDRTPKPAPGGGERGRGGRDQGPAAGAGKCTSGKACKDGGEGLRRDQCRKRQALDCSPAAASL